MTKDGLARRLASRLGVSNEAAIRILNETCQAIGDVLKGGENVKIRDFGTWYVRDIKAIERKVSVGPHIGKSYTSPEYRRVCFRSGGGLRKEVNG